MKKSFFLGALAALLLPTLATAQSPFDGTWKIDTNKIDFPKNPDVFRIKPGQF